MRQNISLDQPVGAETWLIPREADRQVDVTRPSPLTRIGAPLGSPVAGGVDALIA